MDVYTEINFANGWKVAVSNDENVLVTLVNPNGYIVSDIKLTDEKIKELLNVIE